MVNYWTEELEELIKPGNRLEIETRDEVMPIEIREIVDENYIVYCFLANGEIYDIDPIEYFYFFSEDDEIEMRVSNESN